MKTKVQILIIFALLMSMIALSCGPGQMFGSTITPTATVTSTFTITPTPTNTSTSTPTLTATLTTTNTPNPTAIPTLGIGSFRISEKDGMKLMYIPEGNFQMGCANCTKWDLNEKPVHTVWLDAYWIDQTDVTNDMYNNCVQAGICQAPLPTNQSEYNQDFVFELIFRVKNNPVVDVDWNQADTYCRRWVGRRLPTEAEWEKAARGTDGRIYPWGNEDIDNQKANFNNNIGFTVPVGNYPDGASPYGVLDMAGNVRQWVSDWFSSNYYQSQTTWRNPTGPATGSAKVTRGSFWGDIGAAPSRTSLRNSVFPNDRYNYYGFRCAISNTP